MEPCARQFATEFDYLPEVRISRMQKSGVRTNHATFSKWSVQGALGFSVIIRVLAQQTTGTRSSYSVLLASIIPASFFGFDTI
jgi:hypothetical protein